MTASQSIGRTIPETHLYGAVFAVAALSYCLSRLTEGHLGLTSDLLAIAGNASCGWSWLLMRALFQRPDAPRRLWPLAPVLVIVAAGTILRFQADHHAPLPRIVGNVETLISSTLMLFAMISPLTGDYRHMPPAEQRFRLLVACGYALLLTVGMIGIDGAPAGSVTARWSGSIKLTCSFLALLEMGAAIWYRDRHPVPDPSKTKRRAPSAEERELGERLIRLMSEETVYAQSELKIADLARSAAEADYKVTQCITGALGFRNFNHMINHFRIEEAKRRLADPRCDHLPILTIALDCGFGSIGPFNRAFKAEASVTPTDYRKGCQRVVEGV